MRNVLESFDEQPKLIQKSNLIPLKLVARFKMKTLIN